MSEPKFTPGPWIYQKHDDFPHTICVYRATNEGDKLVPIDSLYDGWMIPPAFEGTCEANGHLIAQAPAMYRELEYLAELMRGEYGWGEDANRIGALLAACRGES